MRSENSVTVTSKEELKQYLECELPKYGVCGGGSIFFKLVRMLFSESISIF